MGAGKKYLKNQAFSLDCCRSLPAAELKQIVIHTEFRRKFAYPRLTTHRIFSERSVSKRDFLFFLFKILTLLHWR